MISDIENLWLRRLAVVIYATLFVPLAVPVVALWVALRWAAVELGQVANGIYDCWGDR